MMKTTTLCLVLGLTTPAALLAQSSDTTKYNFAMPSLRLTPDARFSGMCNVGIAMPSDANSLHFNASNLVFSEQKFNIGLSYAPSLKLADQFNNYLSLFGRFQKTALGGSMRYVSLGEQLVRTDSLDAAGNTVKDSFGNVVYSQILEKHLNRQIELNFAVAHRFGKNFSASAAIKYLIGSFSSFRDTSGHFIFNPSNAIAVDVSMSYHKEFKIAEKLAMFRMGVAVTNIGTKINYSKPIVNTATAFGSSFLPSNLGIGFAFVYHFDPKHMISIGADFNKLMVPSVLDSVSAQKTMIEALLKSFADSPQGLKGELKEWVYSFGVEYWFNRALSFRLGHQGLDLLNNFKQRLAGGIGYKFSIININASYMRVLDKDAVNNNMVNVSILLDLSNLGKKKDNGSVVPPNQPKQPTTSF